MGSLIHMVGMFNFQETADLFSKWLYHFTFPLSVYENCLLFILVNAMYMVNVFNFSHFNRCVVVSHYGFNLNFHNN